MKFLRDDDDGNNNGKKIGTCTSEHVTNSWMLKTSNWRWISIMIQNFMHMLVVNGWLIAIATKILLEFSATYQH